MRQELARIIDHTLLRPEARPGDVAELCAEARTHGFHAVCVNGVHTRTCAEHLAGSGVVVATVVGFPLGAAHPEVKAAEASRALEDGARELDVVLQIGALRAGDDALVLKDLHGVCGAARKHDGLVKVILETSLLDDEQKIRACELAREAGAAFVKTSTGFAGGGATVADVTLMKRAVGAALGIKASGGIRTAQDAEALIAAGATRIGTSNGVALIGK